MRLLVVLLLGSAPLAGDEPPKPDLAARIDAPCRKFVAGGSVVGMSVAVRGPDGTLVLRGYGRVAKDADGAPDADTIYEIGSITKVFTGVLLASLAREGKVGLDDPVQKHLPRRAPEAITLRHLATHRAGLPRLPPNLKPADIATPYSGYDEKQLYACLASLNPPRAPAPYHYSNFGAGLLGHVLARAAETTYGELVVARVAKPLKMTSTAVGPLPEKPEKLAKRLAPGHRADGTRVGGWPFRDSTLAGAGAVRSSARDMARFAEAQFGDDPVHALARRVHASDGQRMGLGWHVTGDGVCWHNGQTAGYHAYIAVRPSDRTAVVVLANTASMAVDGLGRKLLELAAGEE